MTLKPWLATLALAGLVACGSNATAGLFDRIRERAEERRERQEAREEEAELAAKLAAGGPVAPAGLGSPTSFPVADDRDIGKLIQPVSYQPMAAPGALDGPLRPVPEPYVPGPAPAGSSYPPSPVESYSVPSGPVYPGEGYPAPGPAYPVGLEGFPLYPRVEYEDLDHIHPCGVPTIVQVLDPCENPCRTCGPRCVYVKICIPPNIPPRIKVEDHGRKVKYKFGDYQVEIESEDGVVSVDYDD